MTVTEAARILEISPDLVYRLCQLRRLGHVRIGTGAGRIRISRSDLDCYLAAHRVETIDPDERPRLRRAAAIKFPGIIDAALAERAARRRRG
jgi:excisionase family DNA binding protein